MQEGLGIGSFLAARIMLLHGGEIRTEPRSGGGSVITLGFRSPTEWQRDGTGPR
jgi:signal transduction histidine kinase